MPSNLVTRVTKAEKFKQEGNSLKDLRQMNDLNDLNNYYTVIGTYSIVVIIWSYLDFDISF